MMSVKLRCGLLPNGFATLLVVPGIAAAQAGGAFGFGRFAQQTVSSGSSLVHINAPVNLALIAVAVGLAAAGGLAAGAVGGLRASRLRPADALRTVE